MLKATSSKTASLGKTFAGYLLANKFMAGVGVYLVAVAVLKAATTLDLGIPCLWKALSGHRCPGCGLTTALVALLKLDFHGAFAANGLIYVVLPAGLLFVVKDFVAYRQRTPPLVGRQE